VEIEHACEKSCACTTCHVVVREGFDTLDPSEERRTTCSTRPGTGAEFAPLLPGDRQDNDLTVEIPKYTINMVKEIK